MGLWRSKSGLSVNRYVMQKEVITCSSDVNVKSREVHFENDALFMISIR